MSTQPPDQLSIIERIERAMVLLAYFIELDGDVHVPMFEKFEAELKELRKAEDVKARARRLLSLYGAAGGLKAIGPRDVISKHREDASPRVGVTHPMIFVGGATVDPAS